MQVNFTTQIWKEGKMYVAYAPELDVSSCGKTTQEAKEHLLGAVEAFLSEAKRMGTLNAILKESGFQQESRAQWIAPEWLALSNITLNKN